jgi:hypothetical protein
MKLQGIVPEVKLTENETGVSFSSINIPYKPMHVACSAVTFVGECLVSYNSYRRQFYTLQDGYHIRSACDSNEKSPCLSQNRSQVLQLVASLCQSSSSWFLLQNESVVEEDYSAVCNPLAISSRMLTVLTERFHGFPQPFQANDVSLLQIRLLPFSSKYLPVIYSRSNSH